MRLIDADVLSDGLYDGEVNNGGDLLMALFQMVIDETPTVDAVPVVRCKDCVYWNPYKSHHYKGHFCDVVTLFVQENEYCAWGKRKGGEE